MKKKSVFCLSVVLAFCFVASGVQAATTISLQPNLPVVNLSDQIIITVALTSDPPGILSGAVDFTYDDSLAQFVSFEIGSGVDPGFVFFPNTPPPPPPQPGSTQSPLGQINNYGFGNFNGVSSPVAVITFDPIAAGIADFGILFDADVTGGGWFDGNGAPLDLGTVTLSGTSVSVNIVPIPGSILLLGSGVLGLVGLSRRKRS
jgi:hypothetical protein